MSSWARSCSVGYDLRIVFQFVQLEGSEAVLLETVGNPDGYWPDTYSYFQTAITLTLHSLGPNEWIEHCRRR